MTNGSSIYVTTSIYLFIYLLSCVWLSNCQVLIKMSSTELSQVGN